MQITYLIFQEARNIAQTWPLWKMFSELSHIRILVVSEISYFKSRIWNGGDLSDACLIENLKSWASASCQSYSRQCSCLQQTGMWTRELLGNRLEAPCVNHDSCRNHIFVIIETGAEKRYLKLQQWTKGKQEAPARNRNRRTQFDPTTPETRGNEPLLGILSYFPLTHCQILC